VLAEIFPFAQRKINVPVFTATDKSDGPGLPHFRTHPHAPAAQNTVAVPEGVAHLLYPAAYRDVLDCFGVRGLGYQQFCDVSAQFFYFFRIADYRHALLDIQRAGGSNF
jgi:hypothetical protein